MDLGHWNFSVEFNVDEWFGFIYRIIELDTNREYLGKKQFTKMKSKIVKGRKNRKRTILESDWKTYTGSSTALNEQILLKGKDNYRFEIVSLHKSRGSLHYAEVCIQINENVLRAKLPDGTRKYYNRVINGVKYIPPDEVTEEYLIKQSNAKLRFYKTDEGEKLKKYLSELPHKSGEDHPLFGKVRPDDVKKKISDGNKGKQAGSNNPMFGKPCFYNMTEDQVQQWKQNISKATKGKPKSDNMRSRLSNSIKGIPKKKVECPHCKKIGGEGNMKRYHFNNCKLLRNIDQTDGT